MSDHCQRIEVITGPARRRRWTTEEKLRIVDETLRSGEGISVSRRTRSLLTAFTLVLGRLRVHPARNGEIVRGAFVLDAHDREVIAWRATANTGVGGSDIRDMMLEAVEVRFGGIRAAHPVEWLSDNVLCWELSAA